MKAPLRTAATAILTLLTALTVGTANGAQTCVELFQSQPSPLELSKPKNLFAAKFSDTKQESKFWRMFDRGVGQQFRVRVITAEIPAALQAATEARFARLLADGFRLEPTEGDESKLTFRGSFDQILTAIQDPSVTAVESVKDLTIAPYPKTFSVAAPAHGRPYGAEPLAVKFKTMALYQRFRAALTDEVVELVQITVVTAFRDPDQSSVFEHDVRGLGVKVETRHSTGHVATLLMTSSAEKLWAVIRHPGVRGVTDAVKVAAPVVRSRHIDMLAIRNKVRDGLLNTSARMKFVFNEDAATEADGVVFQATRDSGTRSLIRVETREATNRVPHEVRTAHDYARFVARYYNRDFAYVSQLDGIDVPAFDGLTLNRNTAEPYENVSLKYCERCVEFVEEMVLLAEIRRRIKLQLEKESHFNDFAAWFEAVNFGENLSFTGQTKDYDKLFSRAVRAAALFGLLPKDRPYLRATQLVIDMRDHGYGLDYFKNADIQAHLLSTLRHTSAGKPIELTLIWNDRQGVVISKSGVTFHE